jgi:hypothetical protein
MTQGSASHAGISTLIRDNNVCGLFYPWLRYFFATRAKNPFLADLRRRLWTPDGGTSRTPS